MIPEKKLDEKRKHGDGCFLCDSGCLMCWVFFLPIFVLGSVFGLVSKGAVQHKWGKRRENEGKRGTEKIWWFWETGWFGRMRCRVEIGGKGPTLGGVSV